MRWIAFLLLLTASCATPPAPHPSPELESQPARRPIDEVTVVEAVIDENGNVTDACPLQGDPRFLAATVEAVKEWKFAPGTIDGHPATLRFNLTTRFRMN